MNESAKIALQQYQEKVANGENLDVMSVGYLNECFDYNDGELIWKLRPLHHFKSTSQMKTTNTQFGGCVAGTLKDNGYVSVQIMGKSLYAHRIIFLLLNGYLPSLIDHIDRNRKNNRIENLREATYLTNATNKNTNKNNKSGVRGVHFDKATKKWTANFKVNGKTKYLGSFSDIYDAIKIRRDYESLHWDKDQSK